MRLAVACLVLAGASLLVVPAAPGYDPLAWLVWGRELASGTLSTTDGPAFKPGAVALATLAAPAGDAAPWLFLLVVRAATIASVVAVVLLARRLAGGAVTAAILTAVLVVALPRVGLLGGAGYVDVLVAGLAAAALLARRDGRHELALAGAAGACLLRVEAWPFALVLAAFAWHERSVPRGALAALAGAVGAAWLVPELLGSGELLRSGTRALVAEPGQPALAPVPALEALRQALDPVALVVLALAALAPRDARLPAVVGVGWLLLVAAMAQVGFSGEPRYALPGLVLAAASAGAGGVRVVHALRVAPAPARLAAAPLIALVLLAGAAHRGPGIEREADRLVASAAFAADLDRAVELAGGRGSLRRCGAPATGPLRGPLVAYHLGVARREVRFVAPRQGLVLRSRRGSEPTPVPVAPAGFTPRSRTSAWEVLSRCG